MHFVSRAALLVVIAALCAGCGGGRGGSVPSNAPVAAMPGGFTVPPSVALAVPPNPPNFVPGKPSTVRRTSTVHASFFAGEVALSNGVYYLALPNGTPFGYYSYLPDSNYIYHFDMGYEYVADANDGKGGVYFYDFASAHWWYTGRQYPFPYIYDFSLNAFLYYYPDTKNAGHYTTNPRYFYNFKAGKIIALPRYTSVVVFGDSLSDTGNVANVMQQSYAVTYPGTAFNYADGRFTDGTSTSPAAQRYTGIWIEQLAATFAAKPVVNDSLDGGIDYAYGGATTADGTTNVATSASLTVPVENIGQQVSDYLAGHPKMNSTTLFVVWAGTDELLNSANNSAAFANAAAAREVAVVQRLIDAGATDLLVPNVPPLGALPSFSGSGNASAKTQAAASFNQTLASGLANLPAANSTRTLRIVPLDVFALFNATIASPGGAGFANATSSAQGNAGVNPDSYLFWDGTHPTTAGHHLITASAADAIASP